MRAILSTLLLLSFLAGCNRSGSGPSEATKRAAGATITGWGTVLDPDGDCLVREEENGVSIAIPKTFHEINPTREKQNAPLILRWVDGDFRVVVRVTGEFLPNAKSTSPGGAPFHGAGLVLYHDSRNFLVLARNCWTKQGGPSSGLCFAPLFELFEDGQSRDTNPPVTAATVFQGTSTSLYLERRGDAVRGAFSNDAKTWEGWRETKVRFPRKARVGVTAVNTSAEAFTVEFDGFKNLDE